MTRSRFPLLLGAIVALAVTSLACAARSGYAVYLGASKALHAVELANGKDRIVARAGQGWYRNGIDIQAPGVMAPLTTKSGDLFPVTFSFVPMR
jgi:hypothetical protein